MSTGSSTQPATYPETPVRQRRGFPRLRDARIRSKLALILFVPLLAVLALATVRLIDVGSRAIDATQVEDLTRLSTDVSELTQVMHKERMAAARFLATPDGQEDVVPPGSGAPAPKPAPPGDDAAILPFIDPGLAKDANCAGLIAEAGRQGAPVKTAAR